MRYIRLSVFLTLLIVAWSTVAQQQSTSPTATVTKYCQLDFNGARTRSETFEKLDHMVLWHTEPGWDVARLVRSYKIVSVRTTGTRSAVTVEYDVIGDVEGGEQLTKNPHKERVVFSLELGDKEWVWHGENPVLVKSGRAWRIKSPVQKPTTAR